LHSKQNARPILGGILRLQQVDGSIGKGGEQQRVAIARAICHEPAVVIADEPTGNLDDSTAEGVLELLDKLVRERGGTMLIATHSARVASVCDREIEIHSGKLEATARDAESR